MRIKFLISIILISFFSFGQKIQEDITMDSTKIKIIGDSIYRVHQGKNKKKGPNWKTSINYTKANLANVLFKQSKSEILPESFDKLDDLVDLLINNPTIKIEVNGYTDKVGDSKTNLRLSIIRARMIKIYFTKRGIKPNRISTNGFGDQSPICKSPCKENQRVEFTLKI